MAAYAALLSLKHTIEQIHHHPRPPISLDQDQVDSLTRNINFLQDFLEDYTCGGSGEEASRDVLESRIADAAHAAEDIIETRVVDQILGGSKKIKKENTRIKDHLHRILLCGAGSSRSPSTRQNVSSVDFPRELEKVIRDIGFTKKDVMEIKDDTGIKDPLHKMLSTLCGSSRYPSKRQNVSSIDFQPDLDKVIQDMGFIKNDVMEIKGNIGIEHLNSSTRAGDCSSRSPLTTKLKTMIGFDDLLVEIMDKLTREQSSLQVISIVGMGGIGKTTLARNAYENPLIKEQFHICAWVTISQNYNVQEILVEILLCISKEESREIWSAKSEGELGEKVHKSLWGWRYLIVMDDIWSIDAWDKIKIFLPDNSQGSRIMTTTRLSKVALTGSHGLMIDFLDEDKSWDLLRINMFEEEECPPELEQIGKKIAKNCKGLPLSIVVIGGLLGKSKPTREHWEYISKNLNTIVNLEDNERCLRVLQLSYHHLPVHLKPCFLYMGVFPEDSNIRVSSLVKLWVSEGFLKPISGKSLEVVSRDYLQELCDRNLILVRQRRSNGGIKYCNMHDLVRELCLREAEKEKFLYVTRPHDLNIPQGIINTQRRIGIHQSTSKKEYIPEALGALNSVRFACSLICEFEGVLPSLNFRLLRVLKTVDKYLYFQKSLQDRYFLEDVFQLVNSRYLAVRADWRRYPQFPSSVNLLWNLQTLIVTGTVDAIAPSEIWKMTQLRHIQFDRLDLSDPPPGMQDGDFVLGNLQTLLKIRNFKCGEEVVKRIPIINKLQICYYDVSKGCSSYRLNNIGRLCDLESLYFFFHSEASPNRHDLVQNFILPNSLKKLTLEGTNLHWEDMKTKIGLLPNLQVLKLKENSFVGAEWETIEGQFCNLRFLLISMLISGDLQCWTTDDSSHFPRLEHLTLKGLHKLEEIPSCIGDIPTLQSIHLGGCRESAVISAKRILEEQEDLLGNVGLQVRVSLRNHQKHLESLASPNFQVETPLLRSGKPLLSLDKADEHHEEEEKSKSRAVTYSYSFFHLLFSLASMYSVMLLTGWSTSVGESGKLVDVGWASVWVRIITSWATSALIIWSLVAPILFPDREF